MLTCIRSHGLKRSWRSCPRRVNASNVNTPSMHHPQRRNVTTSVIGLKILNGHTRKNLTENGEPQRCIAGECRRRRIQGCKLLNVCRNSSTMHIELQTLQLTDIWGERGEAYFLVCFNCCMLTHFYYLLRVWFRDETVRQSEVKFFRLDSLFHWRPCWPSGKVLALRAARQTWVWFLISQWIFFQFWVIPVTWKSTKTECNYLNSWIKNGHIRKNLTQNGEPQRYSW